MTKRRGCLVNCTRCCVCDGQARDKGGIQGTRSGVWMWAWRWDGLDGRMTGLIGKA
jgi:hypothetical protein